MADKRFSGGDSVQNMRIRSALCVPIKYKDTIFGVIHVDSQIVNYTFTEDQLRLLTAVGVHTGLALANAQLYATQLQRERLAAVGQTVASLSHSVRNIIQGLQGGADVVELGLRKKSMKVVSGGWGIVSRNLDRIHSLTINMLAFAKQRTLDREMANINSLLDEVVALAQNQYDDKKVALITDLDQNMPPMPLDSSGIHQSILNLLNNALDAVETKKGVVSLRSEFDDRHLCAQISISDNGMGISAETRKHLFEPFHSTKGLRGTGLGLVVTKKIIDEHGGSIRVQSAPAKGTTFTVTIPVKGEETPSLADTQDPAVIL
jgi:signal transduction histidine kinase